MKKRNSGHRLPPVAPDIARLSTFFRKRITPCPALLFPLKSPAFIHRIIFSTRKTIVYLFSIIIFSGSLIIFSSSSCLAQSNADETLEYPVKAAFLYKFCLYINWPASAFSNADSPIVLGVAGPAIMIDELNSAVRERTINNRRVEVHRVDPGSDLTGLHLLFVARSEQPVLRNVASKTQNIPLLLVSEVNDGLDEGAGINFIVKDNKVRFDVALDTTSRQGLHLSAQLLKVAHDIRGENSR